MKKKEEEEEEEEEEKKKKKKKKMEEDFVKQICKAFLVGLAKNQDKTHTWGRSNIEAALASFQSS